MRPVQMGSVSALVAPLRDAVGPPTITRLIVLVTVDSIKRQSRQPRTHVREKCLIRLSPLITNRDATPAVPLPVNIARVRASLVHCAPGTVLWGVLDRRAVSELQAAIDVNLEAAARANIAAQEVRGLNDSLTTARAATDEPAATRAASRRVGLDGEPIKVIADTDIGFGFTSTDGVLSHEFPLSTRWSQAACRASRLQCGPKIARPR